MPKPNRHGGGTRARMVEGLSEEDRLAIVAELDLMRQEHRDLDAAIDALAGAATCDQIQLQRLKKRKLVLRDKISQLEDRLFPDIIA